MINTRLSAVNVIGFSVDLSCKCICLSNFNLPYYQDLENLTGF